jgi:hypothetical protein
MQLDDPSNMPDLWEGPLPVPRPTSPFKRTPVEDITEDLLIEPQTPNPEPEVEYPEDLYMEENLEPPDPPVHMDTKQDPEPSKLPTLPTVKLLAKKTTKFTNLSPSGGGGGYIPETKARKTPKKKIPPPVQPKMKTGGLEQLREYNQEFKRWQLRLVGRVLDNKETIRAYVTGLQSKILTVLLKDGYKFKDIKTLAKWQKAAEMAVAKFEKKAGQESTADRQKSVRLPLQKLKEITVWKQMKQLSKADRKKIIEELAIKFLEGEQLVAVIRKLDVDAMYISKKKSLQLPLNIVTYQGKQENITLIDSGATNNFIDFRTVNKLGLGTRKVPRPIELYNVDGTHNQDGKIERSIHLYIDDGQRCIQTPFFVTNLGKDRIILGYPWFEAFNPKINWKEGRLLGPQIELKTTGAVSREHVEQAYEIRRIAMELRKTTIAQKMAEAFHTDKPKTETPIPPEYRRHVKVFSEQEAERFPPSRTWDHRIPLKDNAPETINEKLYNLPKVDKQAIEEWAYKMLKKGFIERSDSPYGHATFTIPKKDGTRRIVQDYRPVNKYTKKDTTPLPDIQDAVESLGDKTLFSKFDIREGYNNIQLVPEDRWKAAFKTHIGLFQPTVMVFGLQGAPGTFSRMIAVDVAPMYREFPPDRFKHYMDDCLVATADRELALHRRMTHRLLDIFEEHSYFLKPSKCEFEWTEIDSLGVCLGHGQITIDPSKIAGIKDWPRTLKSVKEVRSTLGVLSFQRPFIPGFANLAKPLTNLLKKDSTFSWTPECTEALDRLIHIVTSEPILVPPDTSQQFILEVDASQYATGAILFQADKKMTDRRSKPILWPCGYHSQTFSATEQRYPIYDREFLAII